METSSNSESCTYKVYPDGTVVEVKVPTTPTIYKVFPDGTVMEVKHKDSS